MMPRSAFKLAARVGLAPTPCGLTNRRATLTPPGNWKLALPAGFSPASFRLEGGCLMCSATAAIEKWSARQELHLRSLGPKPSALAATLRADAPGGFRERRSGETRCRNPGNRPRGKLGNWRTRRESHPQPSRRQRGALLIELRIQKWWEVLVTLQPSLPADLVTPGLQPGDRITSLKLVAGVGVTPT